MNTRRAFIQSLAASPLYAGAPYFARCFAQTPQAQPVDGLIAHAGDALDVFDFEPVAHGNIGVGACNLRDITRASLIHQETIRG
jgi:hypothetical protein